MLKKVELTKGKHAMVDDCDFDYISTFSWYAHSGGYAAAKHPVTKKIVYMHRIITGAPAGMDVDHKNHDKLDNRRENLRVCSRSDNLRNSRGIGGFSQYKGVTLKRGRKKPWRARISVNGEQIHLGDYFTEIEAAFAYDIAAKKYYGEFAYLNGVYVPNFKHFEPRKPSSAQPGVAWCNTKNRWRTTIIINGKSHHLGYFREEADAIQARLKAEKEGVAG